MNRLLAVLALALSLGTTALAAEPVSETFDVPLDRAWSVAEAVLKQLGWEVDKADRTIGWITTDSRRIEFEDYGVYAKGTRHRLVLHVKAAGTNRTTLSVERSVFKRERILWMDNDAAIQTTDQSVEKALIAAIRKSL